MSQPHETSILNSCTDPPSQRGPDDLLQDLLATVGPKINDQLLRRFRGSFNEQDVEDVLAVALQRAWRNRDKFDPQKGTVYAWFYQIAVRTALNVLKKKTGLREVALDRDAAWHADPVAPDRPDPEPSNAAPRLYEDLLEILETLEDDERTIILRYASLVCPDDEGRNRVAWAHDLARELGMKPAHLRVKCFRVKARIRRELRNRGHTAL